MSNKTENDGKNFHEPESPQAIRVSKMQKELSFL